MPRPAIVMAALPAFCLVLSTFGQTIAPRSTPTPSELRQRAEAGDAKAQTELGWMYEFGADGFPKDPVEALKWYHKAADQGDTVAKASIARMYFYGTGVAKDYSEAARWYGCPKPDTGALADCRQISYKDLPRGARALLKQMNCFVSSNYDYGSAVDLNGDGKPEYQVCCRDSPHGPCGAVVIGKIGAAWKNLTAKQGVLGFVTACDGFVVLESRHGGFNDICLPDRCSTVASRAGKPCVPTIWHFVGGRYRTAP